MGKHSRNFGRRSPRANYEFQRAPLPDRLPLEKGRRLIRVFVEGYEDVAFWRGVFDDYESAKLCFEISVPARDDLAKGKKVVVKQATSEVVPADTLYCVDSDFDYLFSDQTEFARLINSSPTIFHTYAYATENFLCYAPSLHNICVKATKNDVRIFDFERFFREYSKVIFPLFLWYAYSAQINSPNIFTLMDFKSSVKLNYLEVENNGADTLLWLERQVAKRLGSLRHQHTNVEDKLPAFVRMLENRGVTPQNTYLFMQGHALMDNVVMPVLYAVCEKLRQISVARIASSRSGTVPQSNDLSNYNNSLEDVRNALMFNENYKDCFLYRKVKQDIEQYLRGTKAI